MNANIEDRRTAQPSEDAREDMDPTTSGTGDGETGRSGQLEPSDGELLARAKF